MIPAQAPYVAIKNVTFAYPYTLMIKGTDGVYRDWQTNANQLANGVLAYNGETVRLRVSAPVHKTTKAFEIWIVSSGKLTYITSVWFTTANQNTLDCVLTVGGTTTDSTVSVATTYTAEYNQFTP